MPTLYPENTQYGSAGSPKVPTVRYPSLTQKTNAPKKTLKQGNFGAFAEAPKGLSEADRMAMASPQLNFPIHGPMITPPDALQTMTLADFLKKNEPNEPGGTYDFSKPGTFSSAKYWADPTDKTISTILPADQGGGEYLSDPSQPGKIIRTARDFSPDENALIRNGLNPAFYQIDHIVPLWAGGANTLENRQILRVDEHAKKTKVQAVPLTLMANGIITPEEALKTSFGWKEKDDSRLGEVDKYGMLPLDLAKREFENWKKQAAGQPIDTGSSWKNFMNTIESMPKNLYKKAGNFYRDVLLGGGDETIAASVTKEFGKGLVSAIPFADVMVPDLAKVGNYADPQLAKAANLMAFQGRLTGDLLAFGAIRAAAAKAMGALGVARFARAAEGLTEAEKSAALASKALKSGKSVLSSPTLGVTRTGIGRYAIPEITSKTVGIANLNESLKLGATMAALGQTHLQPDGADDIESRIKKMTADMIFGSVLGTQGHSFAGYSRVGGLAMTIGLMQGQDSADAALNSITMMALHGLGHTSKNNILGLAMEDPQYAAYVKSRGAKGATTEVAEAKAGVVKKALGTVGNNLYAPDVDARMIKAAQNTILKKMQEKAVGEATQFRMSWLGKEYERGTDRDTIQRQNALIHDKINRVAAENEWGPEAVRAAKFQAYVSGRELYKSTLPTEIRAKEDMADLLSVGAKVSENKGQDIVLGVPKDVEKIVNNLPEEMFGKPDMFKVHSSSSRADLPHGVAPLGGSGLQPGKSPEKDALDYMVSLADTGKAPVTKIVDEATGGDAYLMRGILAYEPENHSVMLDINKGMDPARIARGDIKPMQHPENYMGIFAYGKDANGDPFVTRVTPIAREFRIRKLNESWSRSGNPTLMMRSMDPKMNKDTLSDAFKKNGLKYSLVDFVYIPQTGVIAQDTGVPTSFAKAYINEDVFTNNAKIVADALKAPDPATINIPVVREALTMKKTAPAQPQEAPTFKPTLANTGITARPAAPETGRTPDSGPAAIAKTVESNPVETAKPQAEQPVVKAEIKNPVVIAEENPNASVIRPKEFSTEDAVGKQPSVSELTKNTDLEDYVVPRSWTEFDAENLNKGAGKTIDNAIKASEPGSEEAFKLGELKKEFSKEGILKTAKEISAKHGPQGDDAAKEEFKKTISDKFKAAGLEDPTTDKRISRVLNRMFVQAAYSRPRNIISYKSGEGFVTAERAPQLDSYLDDQIDAYIAKHPESKGMDLIYFENPEIKKPTKKASEIASSEENSSLADMDIDPQKIRNEMQKKGYVAMGASGNARHTMWGVKFIPEMANGGSINDPAARSAFTEKFLREVVGFKGSSADTVVKRSKLFNSHNATHPAKGMKLTNYVLNSETLGDLGIVGKEGSKFSSNTSPEAKSNMLNKSAYDGKIFMTKEAIQEILEKGGYVGTRARLKPTMAYRTDEGLVLQKGDVSVLDDYHKKLFEDQIGKKIDKYDVITFEDNIKSGLESAKPSGEGRFKILETPSESWRFAYSHPHESTGTLSFGSILSKFTNADGINGAMMELYGPEVTKFRAFVDEIQRAKDSSDLKSIFKKYEEYGKSEFADNLYGKVKKMVDNGADVMAIGKNIDTMINRIFQDHVVAGKFINADHLTLTPDFRSKLNSATGQREFLGPNEIMLSEKTFKKMYGEEALQKLRNGEDYYALTVRYPVTRKTALSKAKIYIAEDNGIKSLGDEQMIPSLFDTYVRKEGDFDADAFTIFKIGGEKGLPQSLADRVEQVRSTDGDIALDPLTSFKKTPLDAENAESALMDITDKAIQGGQAVARTAAMNRLMPSLVEGKMKVVLHPSSGGARKADIYFGDNLYKTIDILNSRGVDTVEITPHYNKDDEKLVSQILQASTDSAKSPYLADTLKSANIKKVEDFLAKSLFKNVNNQEEMNAVQAVMFEFQTPYTISNAGKKIKSSVDLFKQIEDYNKSSEAITSSGGKLGPVQEIMTAFKGQKGFDYGFGDPKTQWRVDEAGVKAVESKFKGEYIQTQDVKSFQEFVNKARTEYTKPENSKNYELKNDILDSINAKYAEMEPSLTPEEKKSIAYWLVTSPDANLQNKSEWLAKNTRDRTGFVQRLDFIFNDVPDIAREYYSGRAAYVPEESAAVIAPVATAVAIKNPVSKYTGLKKVVVSTPEGATKAAQEALAKRPKT